MPRVGVLTVRGFVATDGLGVAFLGVEHASAGEIPRQAASMIGHTVELHACLIDEPLLDKLAG